MEFGTQPAEGMLEADLRDASAGLRCREAAARCGLCKAAIKNEE